MEYSNFYQPYFVHTQGAMATNPSHDMRMGFSLNQQNLVDVPSHHLFINEPPDLSQNNRNNKFRLRWTEELHGRFLDAVHELGGAFETTPKAIHNTMGIDGITLYHVKSHLQKFRQGLASGQLVRRRNINRTRSFLFEEAPNVDLDAILSDGSGIGSSNSTMATSSCIESEPFDVQNDLENNELLFQPEDDQGIQVAPDQSIDIFEIEELVPTDQQTPVVPNQRDEQVPTTELGQAQASSSEDEIDLLPFMAFSPIYDYLNHFDPPGDTETDNLPTSSEPAREQAGSYEEVVEALPPLMPSSMETGYWTHWTMEDLLAMEFDKPWDF